jgi:hypothetical protein
MASLLSTTERANLTSIFTDIFDTFKRTVTIHKEPKKIITTINESALFGYSDSSNVVNYSYESVSSSFEATIRYVESARDDYFAKDLNSYLEGTLVRIKVKKDARDYIESSPTEKVTFDNKNFKVVGNDTVKTFLDSTFYVFYLKEA